MQRGGYSQLQAESQKERVRVAFPRDASFLRFFVLKSVCGWDLSIALGEQPSEAVEGVGGLRGGGGLL